MKSEIRKKGEIRNKKNDDHGKKFRNLHLVKRNAVKESYLGKMVGLKT